MIVLAEHGHKRFGFFIPGGILIGLGIGMVFGRADIGVLMGLGAGFILSGILKEWAGRSEDQVPPATSTYFMILIGILFVIYGAGLLWFPAMIYPYLSAILVILLGIWLIVSGMRR